MLAHWSVAILTAALAVALFLASSGVEIDVKGRRARICKALGRLRSGQWVSTERYTGIAIHHTRESQVMTSRASQTTVRVRTYDVRLTTAGGELCCSTISPTMRRPASVQWPWPKVGSWN